MGGEGEVYVSDNGHRVQMFMCEGMCVGARGGVGSEKEREEKKARKKKKKNRGYVFVKRVISRVCAFPRLPDATLWGAGGQSFLSYQICCE